MDGLITDEGLRQLVKRFTGGQGCIDVVKFPFCDTL